MRFPPLSFIWMVFSLHVARLRALYVPAFIVILGIPFVWGVVLFPSEGRFGEAHIITIPEGASFEEITNILIEENIISSALAFRLATSVIGSDRGVQAGTYVFYEKEGVYKTSKRLLTGESGLFPITVTFPEGITVRDMADILSLKLPDFDRETFLSLATPLEGYLFPDTYQFAPQASPETIIVILHQNFTKKTEELAPLLENTEYSLHKIVTTASILEKEARTFETRRMIAGILYARLDIDMPLQVDAVFGYILGQPTFHPSLSDLEIDSPYNTYRYRGLPPGPIGNPGIESLQAALLPTSSPYLFYLTGRDGQMYYAVDFDGHRENRRRFLD